MRFAIIALLILAGVHGCIVRRETNKLNRLYNESKAIMINDVGGALSHFEEARRITDLQTFGKASNDLKWAPSSGLPLMATDRPNRLVMIPINSCQCSIGHPR